MFDIGFSEIVVCAVIALVVIGPERMPETVRTLGLWIGRIKRSLRETRSEIERQIGVDDIRRQLHNEEIMQSLEKARQDMDNTITQAQQNMATHVDSVITEYKSEPDLPYHSHTNEPVNISSTETTIGATESIQQNATPPQDVVVENPSEAEIFANTNTNTTITNSPTDKKAPL